MKNLKSFLNREFLNGKVKRYELLLGYGIAIAAASGIIALANMLVVTCIVIFFLSFALAITEGVIQLTVKDQEYCDFVADQIDIALGKAPVTNLFGGSIKHKLMQAGIIIVSFSVACIMYAIAEFFTALFLTAGFFLGIFALVGVIVFTMAYCFSAWTAALVLIDFVFGKGDVEAAPSL